MKQLRYFLYLLLITIYSCNGQPSDLDKKIASFQQQQHRFEFRGHQLYYNNTEVLLDQPLSYYENIFGKDYELKHYDERVEYNNIPIVLNKGMDSIIDTARIHLYYLDQNMVNESEHEPHTRNPNKFYPAILDEQYLLIDGIPINKNTNILEDVNPILQRQNDPLFTRGLAGTKGITRQYVNENGDLSIYIYIYRGLEVSPVTFIWYGDSSDR